MKIPNSVKKNDELRFYHALINRKTGDFMIGRWIGTVAVVNYKDEDGTNLYLAYQLASGRIVYVEECNPALPMTVHSLKGKLHDIRWGYYLAGFEKEWQYCVF